MKVRLYKLWLDIVYQKALEHSKHDPMDVMFSGVPMSKMFSTTKGFRWLSYDKQRSPLGSSAGKLLYACRCSIGLMHWKELGPDRGQDKQKFCRRWQQFSRKYRSNENVLLRAIKGEKEQGFFTRTCHVIRFLCERNHMKEYTDEH